jgi:hypothetical protein
MKKRSSKIAIVDDQKEEKIDVDALQITTNSSTDSPTTNNNVSHTFLEEKMDKSTTKFHSSFMPPRTREPRLSGRPEGLSSYLNSKFLRI